MKSIYFAKIEFEKFTNFQCKICIKMEDIEHSTDPRSLNTIERLFFYYVLGCYATASFIWYTNKKNITDSQYNAKCGAKRNKIIRKAFDYGVIWPYSVPRMIYDYYYKPANYHQHVEPISLRAPGIPPQYFIENLFVSVCVVSCVGLPLYRYPYRPSQLRH
jgi:hypothetical protein